jgi:diaminohydroxyphosphoribosylaminopyrimidine deaminase/5-amino-6-(5-phosphoribosylamino)uracil reductase
VNICVTLVPEAGKPHAEVNALKTSFLKQYPTSQLKELEASQEIHNFLIKNHNNLFHDCTIFVTLEPCNHIGKTPACAMLLESVGIKKVVIGTLDSNKAASGGKERLEKAKIAVEVLNLKQSDDLIYPFIKWQENNFKFFKLAMREDGSIDGGYITTQESLNLVHNIRTKLSLMVIGGQTVRADRPTLDARFSFNKKSPDILIYSKSKNIDKTIPLFNIPNRKVTIDDNLLLLNQSNFTMIEGGYTLLENLKDDIDILMLFISHKKQIENKFDFNKLGMQKIYSYFLNDTDEVIYFKPLFGYNNL